MKKKLLQYGISTAVGLLLAVWVLSAEGFFLLYKDAVAKGMVAQLMMILCDAFFVPGILILCLGIMTWIATTGFCDAIRYAMHVATHTILPFFTQSKTKQYYDYKTEREEHRSKPLVFLIFVGIGFCLVSAIFGAFWFTMM